MLESDRFGGGSFVVWGGKMGDQKTYFVVMQDNFNALYRRHLVTISPLFLHIFFFFVGSSSPFRHHIFSHIVRFYVLFIYKFTEHN